MKFIITGRHASGKQEVLNALEDNYNVNVGHEFCTAESYDSSIYIDPRYERYTAKDANDLFENNAYLYISGIDEISSNTSTKDIIRGISQKTFDISDVIILSPVQLVGLNRTCLRKDPICIVWLDNNLNQRINRYAFEERSYNFQDVEDNENEYDKEFVECIYNISKSKILYFYDEDPQRVSLIIKILIDNPQYTDEFLKIFK